MPGRDSEIVAPLRTVLQPVPYLYPDGDCGACALAALLGWPEGRLREIYELAGFDGPAPFDPTTMRRALDVLWCRDLIDEWRDEPLVPATEDLFPGSWGYGPVAMADPWFDRLQLYLLAGWVGLVNIRLDGTGPDRVAADGSVILVPPDHYVVLAGACRRHDVEGTWRDEVRVLCSSTRTPDVYWIDVRRFLWRQGGFRPFWVRPRPPRPPRTHGVWG